MYPALTNLPFNTKCFLNHVDKRLLHRTYVPMLKVSAQSDTLAYFVTYTIRVYHGLYWSGHPFGLETGIS